MRVAVADDHAVYREGLIRFLRLCEAEVVAQAASGAELLALLDPESLPDVVVLDLQMAGRHDDGLVAALEISERYPGVGILLLSAFAESAYAERLFEKGSAGRGYILKNNLSQVSELKIALDRIQRGLTYSDPLVVDMLLARRRRGRLKDLLTAREWKVCGLVATGASNAAIADELKTTTGSVEGTITSLYTKMGMADVPNYNRRVLIALRWLNEG